MHRRLFSRETFRSVCSVKGHPPDSPRRAPMLIPARRDRQGTKNHSFRSKKLTFREVDRPFETAPKTTRESTSTRSRSVRIPSRVIRLKSLIRLSSSRRLMCLSSKKVEQQPHDHRACCSVVPRLSNQGAHAHLFQKMSQTSCMMDAAHPPAPFGDASAA